jgi:hypothetical protein
LSKKLKRRIREASGIDLLGKDERHQRASEILGDVAEKQSICHRVLGASFKDVEGTMRDLLSEKRSKQQQEYEELMEEAPQKLQPEIENKKRYTPEATQLVYLVDRKEVSSLISESLHSKATQEVVVPADPHSYPTYSLEEVAALIDCNYNPVQFRYVK